MTTLEERRAKMALYFTAKNLAGAPKIHNSPSGKYWLVISDYKTKAGCWGYSRGEVFCGNYLVADIQRNYHSFPFAWVEGHPNGHDFLVCGESYMGQTVVELDTGKRSDSDPEHYGFCWAAIHPSPDKKVLAVDGCVWGAPYEVALFDFREPLKLPYPVLGSWDECEEFDAWESNEALRLVRVRDTRKSDGKLIDDLPEEGWPKLDADWGELRVTKLWTPDCLSIK
jgi:hypothetical protein